MMAWTWLAQEHSMTLSEPELQVVAAAGVILLAFLMYRLVRWTRNKSPDTELWGTIFESLTHYVQPQGPLKEPRQEVRKDKRLSGDDPDKNEPG